MIPIAAVAAIYGIVAQMLFRRLTNASAIKTIANRMITCVLEFRLFFDEPGTVLRAQRNLLRQNFLLLKEIFIPCLVIGVVSALLYLPADRVLGRGSLPVGATAVVTRANVPGVSVETPGVRIAREHTEVWRARVTGSNTLGRTVWIPWFAVLSTLAAVAAQTMDRMRRVVG